MTRTLGLAAAAVAISLAGACSKSTSDPLMGNTNWLTCDRDAECDEGLCACGVCTRSCEAGGDCDGLGAAVCRSNAGGTCGAEVAAAAVCLPACRDAGDCPGDLTCDDGSCVQGLSAPDASTGSDAATELATCDDLPSTLPRVRLFEASRGLIENTIDLPSYTQEFAAVVVELGSGSPDDINGPAFGFGEDATWVRFADEGVTWTLFERGTGMRWPFTAGERVRGEYSAVPGGFSPPELRLRLFRDEREVAYYELGSDLADFEPPSGITLRRGEALCEGRDDCGSFEDARLDVELPGGENLTLEPSEQASSGEHTVDYLHGRHDRDGFTCADVWYSRVELAIVAR